MKLIDKDALVQYLTGMAYAVCCDKNTERIIRKFIIPHINTLEVKEVDLEKSLTGFMGRYAYENGGEYPSAIDIAKHFFELGLKAQKGE